MKKYSLLLLAFLVTIPAVFAQQGWKFKNPPLWSNLNGAICTINKDTVYVIADGGLFFETYDGGTIWTTKKTGFTQHFFDLSFCTVDTGFAVGEKGTIIKTTDGGSNWTSLTSGTMTDLNSISTKNPDNLWVVGDSGVVLNSKNKGTTWIKNGTITVNQLNSVCFRNANIGFIAGNKGTLVGTVNGGTSWNALTIAVTKDLFSLSVTPNYTYLLSGSANSSKFLRGSDVFKTKDNLNWTHSSSITGFPVAIGCASVYFSNDSVGFASASACTNNGDCGIWITKTADYGKTWKNSLVSFSLKPAPGINSKIIFVNDNIGYTFSGNYVLKTIDGGTYTVLGIEEQRIVNDLKIFPTPFSSQTTMHTEKPLKDATLTVYNMYGQIVKQLKNISGQDFTLHRDNLPRGCYFICLTENSMTWPAYKVIIGD
jgi:photosystem II stability/assembly factor-like uncharacterized protein